MAPDNKTDQETTVDWRALAAVQNAYSLMASISQWPASEAYCQEGAGWLMRLELAKRPDVYALYIEAQAREILAVVQEVIADPSSHAFATNEALAISKALNAYQGWKVRHRTILSQFVMPPDYDDVILNAETNDFLNAVRTNV